MKIKCIVVKRFVLGLIGDTLRGLGTNENGNAVEGEGETFIGSTS